MAKVRSRLAADPSVGVADLMECLEGFLKEKDTLQLFKLLKPPEGQSWKTAPHPRWLSELAPLWKLYLKIASNGLIPAKKHRLALVKLQEKKNVNQTKLSPEEWSEKVDEWIRVGLSHLRTLKQQDLVKQRCFRKADAQEKSTIQEVLDLLPELDGPTFAADEDSQPLALLDRASPDAPTPSTPEPPSSSSQKASTPTLILDPAAVFKRVLSRPGIDEKEEEEPQQGKRDCSSPETLKQIWSPDKFQPFLQGLMKTGAVSKQELKRLQEIQDTEPINKGYTSQLQKANKALKKQQLEEEDQDQQEGHEKKGKKQAGKKGPKGKDQKMKKKAGDKKKQECPETKPKAMKKPKHNKKVKKDKAQAKKDDHDGEPMEDAEEEHQDEEAEAASVGEEPTDEPMKGSVGKRKQPVLNTSKSKPEESKKKMATGHTALVIFGEGNVPEEFQPHLDRSSNRKLITSRAYHQASMEGWAENKDWEACKQLGRQAHSAAGTNFDSMWPRTKKPTEDAD